MSLIRDENMAVGLMPQPDGPGHPASDHRRRDRLLVAPRPKRTTSIGSGKRPRRRTHLVASAITTMRREAAATIFSRNSAPPPPLIRLSAAIDLVGAVDGEIELGRLIERRQRHRRRRPGRASLPRSARTITSRPPRTRSPSSSTKGRPSSRCRARASCRAARDRGLSPPPPLSPSIATALTMPLKSPPEPRLPSVVLALGQQVKVLHERD